jgi:hypothetical protein
MFGVSLLVWIALVATIALAFVVISFAYPAIRGALFAPTAPHTIPKMIALLCVQPGKRAVDIGSGDGRIVIALAKAGLEAHGYETNLVLVLWSRYAIRTAGVANRAHIHWRSFWRADFSHYDYVTLFGIFYIMKSLERKLQRELPSGACVVSNYFAFPHWKPSQTESGLLLYKKQ